MKVVDVQLTPVAVSDPPLRNAIGIHQPYALRTILEVVTDEGLVGLGETYGDARMIALLQQAVPQVIGLDPFDLHGLQRGLARVSPAPVAGPSGMELAPGTLAERAAASLFAAFEVAFLDLAAKAAGVRVVDLLGGPVRHAVPFAAYLFFKPARHHGVDADDGWGEALDPDAVVTQARRMVEDHGFGALKLKGGVLEPEVEIATVQALVDAFPDHPVRIDPNAAWTVPTALRVARALEGQLEYLEDPTPTMEGMAAVAREVDVPLATNMVVTTMSDLPRSIELGACQIVLADHHYWGGLRRSQELAAICATWGLGLSMHSNSHLGISLAAMVHLAAATPHMVHSCDTHQPWQQEEVIAGGKLPIVDGMVAIPDGPGLGVQLDRDALARLHEQYQRCGVRSRDDVAEMRRHDPAWSATIPRF